MGMMALYSLHCDKCFSLFADESFHPQMLENYAFADGWVWDGNVQRLGERGYPTGGYLCTTCVTEKENN